MAEILTIMGIVFMAVGVSFIGNVVIDMLISGFNTFEGMWIFIIIGIASCAMAIWLFSLALSFAEPGMC